VSRAMNETDEEEDLSGTSEEQSASAVARTLSWTWQILGMLVGTATAISIIKNGFAIDVYGLPAKVLAQYAWLRDTLLVPLVWAARYFGIEIAWWVKDMMMAYALLAAAHGRAYQSMRRLRMGADFDDVERVPSVPRLDPSRYGILLWPQITAQLVRQWALARADWKYFQGQLRYDEVPFISRPSMTAKEFEDYMSSSNERYRPAIAARGTIDWTTEQLGHIARVHREGRRGGREEGRQVQEEVTRTRTNQGPAQQCVGRFLRLTSRCLKSLRVPAVS
jgi:hypothetical protein